jgi:cystathionine beta-lyase/cystathionine gamma-synthase
MKLKGCAIKLKQDMKFNTKTIRVDNNDPSTGDVMPAIFQTSTFAQTSGSLHVYSRSQIN